MTSAYDKNDEPCRGKGKQTKELTGKIDTVVVPIVDIGALSEQSSMDYARLRHVRNWGSPRTYWDGSHGDCLLQHNAHLLAPIS